MSTRIMVNDRYTYESDFDVQVGDTVICPGGRNPAAKWEAEVTSLDSPYTGPCKKILGVIQEEQEPMVDDGTGDGLPVE